MELSATTASYPVAVHPPARPHPHTAQLGDQPVESRWRVWARRAAPVALTVLITAGAMNAAYEARHSQRSLAIVIANYYLIALLACCLTKLQLMSSPALLEVNAWEPERRRTKAGLFVISIALVGASSLRLADAMPTLAMKLAVWGVAAVGTTVAVYFVFRRRDGRHRQDEQMSPEPEQRV